MKTNQTQVDKAIAKLLRNERYEMAITHASYEKRILGL